VILTAKMHFYGLRAFVDIAKEIRDRGKVLKDLSLQVNFINPGGAIRQIDGHISEDFTTFKIEGVPGIRLLKNPLGIDPVTGRRVVWASYNSLSDIDFRQIAKPYPLSAITPQELENIASSNDLHSLLNTDYSLYLIFFAAGAFFSVIFCSLISIIYKIIVLLITS
jgi:hypothetical protein